MSDYRHLMDLPAGARTAQPFIEKRVDEIVGRFASSEEVQRFAQYIPPLYRHLLEIGVTALGGYLTIHRKKLPKGFAGDLMWVALNRTIDQAASKFGESISGAGEEPAQKGERQMAEEKLAFTKGKERKLHLVMCPNLPAEREAAQGKKGPIPAIKHEYYSVAEARSFKMIAPDGTVAAEFACDNCKDAIAKLGTPVAPKKSKSAAQPQFAPAPPTFGAALAALIMPGQKPPKAAELLAANEDLAEKLDELIGKLRAEERASAHETIVRFLDSEAELKVLTSTNDPDVFRNRLRYIKDKSIGDKLGLPEIEKGLEEISDEVGGIFDDLKKIFGNQQKGNP